MMTEEMNDMTQDCRMTARIDLQGLSQDLQVFKDTLDIWADAVVQKTEKEKMEHAREMGAMRETIRQLKMEEERLEKEAQKVLQRMAQESEEKAALQQEVDALRQRVHELPALVSQVQSILDSESHALWKKKAVTESKEATRRDVARGLQRVIDAYEKRLGLKMHSDVENDEMTLTFTQIDERDPQKEFSISLHVSGERYVVRSCQPDLEAVDTLLDQLNATDDFSEFTINVRKAFKRTCT